MIRNKIPLLGLNDVGFVFDAEDYMTLRTEYRIVGSLVGAVPTTSRTTVTSGLPAILSSVETRLLVEKGIAKLIDPAGLRRAPTEQEKTSYASRASRQIDEHKKLCHEQRMEETRRNLPAIIAGKKRKCASNGMSEDDANITEESILAEAATKSHLENNKTFYELALGHHSPFDGTELQPSPGGSLSEVHYRVFSDLWHRGKFITSGDSFGGDFLVYPGDPLGYHASHIVHVLDNCPTMDAREFICRGRLAVAVNKKCVLVWPDGDRLNYETIEWEGNVAYDK